MGPNVILKNSTRSTLQVAKNSGKPEKSLKVSKIFLFFMIIYLFMRDTEREREAETQAEGEAGSTQGVRYRT